MTEIPNGKHLLKNKNSQKLLEITNASVIAGTKAVQWGPTGHSTQEWDLKSNGSWWNLINGNSAMALQISNCSNTDGSEAEQQPIDGSPCQDWQLTREGIQ